VAGEGPVRAGVAGIGSVIGVFGVSSLEVATSEIIGDLA
jgi:hypothetical protein